MLRNIVLTFCTLIEIWESVHLDVICFKSFQLSKRLTFLVMIIDSIRAGLQQ